MKHISFLIAALAVVLTASLLIASAQSLRFAAILSGAQEVTDPPGGVVTATTGTIDVTFNDALSEATFELVVNGGVGVTEAHFHCGRAGENGPVVAFLFGPVAGIDVDGELASGTLTNANIDIGADCVTAIARPVNNIASLFFAASDGVVRTASAALPEDFSLPRGNILYVPYRHCDLEIVGFSACGSEENELLVDVQDTNHLTYKIVKAFLRSGQPPAQASLGYQPSEQVLDDSLLLLRLVDKVTQTPIVPPPSIILRCPLIVTPSPTIIQNRDPDAGTTTVVGIKASLWACNIEVEITPYYFGASLDNLTIIPGLPHVHVLELTPRPDI